MKPLTHWAIHQEQKLRLHGRSATEIWGQLAGVEGVRPFRYQRQTMRLFIDEDAGARVIQLDDYGFEQPPGQETAGGEAEQP